MKTEINVGRDFSPVPAGRRKEDGPFSGESFRERFLTDAIRNNVKVTVDLSGTEGYGSSFLEEAFGGLVRELGLPPLASSTLPAPRGSAMSLAVAIQMDPLEGVNIDADSDLRAGARGPGARARPLPLSAARPALPRRPRRWRRRGRSRCGGSRATTSPSATPEQIDLAAMDVVLMRQDPPFNLAYISTTHLLDRIHPSTLVVNDPTAVRNSPEKLFVTQFQELMPPTLITYDLDGDPGLPARARRHHRQADLRQWRGRACSTSSRTTPTSPR